MSLGSQGASSLSPVRPSLPINHRGKLMTNAAGVGDKDADQMVERADDLLRRITELEEQLVREEGRGPIVSPVPERPIDEQVREHNVTHTPLVQWCPYCVKGTGRRDAHSKLRKDVPDVEAKIGEVPAISIDYMYLFEKGERPTLVMVDHDSGRVWSYAPKDKAIPSGEGWIQKRIVRDIDNCGHKNIKLKFKSDQEASIVALQHEVQRVRTGCTIPMNSPAVE